MRLPTTCELRKSKKYINIQLNTKRLLFLSVLYVRRGLALTTAGTTAVTTAATDEAGECVSTIVGTSCTAAAAPVQYY